MVQAILTYLAVTVYLVMAYYFFREWLGFFLEDKDMDRQEHSFSSFILVLATVLWPIIVPFAYLELLKFHRKHKEVIDLLISSPNPRLLDE